MQLSYFPVNQVYAFTLGDSIIRLSDYELLYENKQAAIEAARHHGLKVMATGKVIANRLN